MFPFEFTFEGPPLSLQSKSGTRKRAYKSRVAAAARSALPPGFTPTTDDVNIVITYYYEGDTPDVDNIIKPIQDSLNGLVYIDDEQIADTRSRKKDINSSYKIRNASLPIVQAFSDGAEFIHVKIDLYEITEELD